jgi:hypothetical protein
MRRLLHAMGSFRRRESGPVFAAIVTLIYAAVVATSLYHHDMWRDEVHCWMVGKNAYGLRELLFGERIYDGHPFLWYYILHLASLVWNDVRMLKPIAFALATATAYLWIRYVPLPRLLRVLFLASYFVIFEYTVLSRSYTLGLFLVVAFLVVYDPRRVRLWPLSAILSGLAATSVYGLFLAFALALPVFLGRIRIWKTTNPRQFGFYIPRAYLPALALLGLTALFVYYTTPLAADTWFGRKLQYNVDLTGLQLASVRFVKGMLPVPDWHVFDFWNSNVLTQELGRRAWVAWAGLALLLSCLLAFSSQPLVALAFLVGVALMAGLQHVKYEGYTRHFGHFFVLFVACAGLQFKRQPPRRLAWLQILFLLIVIPGVVGGVIATRLSWDRPFSSARMTADFLRAKGLNKRPLIGVGDHMVSGVAGYLDVPIFYMDTHEWGQSVTFHNRRDLNPAATINDTVRSIWAQTEKLPIIVSNVDCCVTTQKDFSIVEIFHAPPTVVADERLRLYEVQPPK